MSGGSDNWLNWLKISEKFEQTDIRCSAAAAPARTRDQPAKAAAPPTISESSLVIAS